VRRLTTDEQRERLQRAKTSRGLCAACGRALGDDEPVYIERVVVGTKRFAGSRARYHTTYVQAPVGIECASPEFLSELGGREPERCAGCGRGVFYRKARGNRHRALCSRYCANRATVGKRSGDLA
jgi:hypothetical protein